jgi:predicted nucleic acid-binding protein
MTFDQIPAGGAVFLDANTLVYHFSAHPKYGAACTRLAERIENQDIQGLTSAHVLGDVVHRLMTIEAIGRFRWPAAGIASRLRKHHDEIPNLGLYRQVPSKVSQLGLQVFPITEALISAAPKLSAQYELLTGDALVVSVMQQHGLTSLASGDADFDRLPGITRYAPI